MELRNLRYFLAIVEFGAIGEAAKHLGIAQPALSQSLSRLEADMGIRLFSRSRRGATLTEAGRMVLEDVRQGIAHINSVMLTASDIAAGQAGKLTIGFVTEALYQVLPKALMAIREELPRVQVVLTEMSNNDQPKALENHEIDVGILHPPVNIERRIREKLIFSEQLIAVMPEDCSPEPDGKVSLLSLAEKGLVLFPMDKLPFMRLKILSAIREFGGKNIVVQEANQTMTVLALVSAGCGVAILPEYIRAITFHGVRYYPIREVDFLPRSELSVIWRSNLSSALANKFVELLGAVDH